MNKTVAKFISTLMIITLVLLSIDFKVFAQDDTNNDERLMLSSQQELTISADGIFIGENFYSIQEFEEMLSQSTNIELSNSIEDEDNLQIGPKPFALTGALVAGTWWIPGVGQAVISTAGVITVAGVTIAAGTWIYNKIVDFFEAKAYENAKKDGKKTKNHSSSKERSLPTKGDSYSSKDQVLDGKLTQRPVL